MNQPRPRADEVTSCRSRPCPACGVSDCRPVGEENGYMWTRCSGCRTTYVARDVTQVQLDTYYADYYAAGNLTVPPIVERRLDEVVSTFASHRRTGRLLDVGFGAGALLDAAERSGWECWGTEVSSSALGAAADKPWTTVQGDLPGLDLPAGSFDVVCMVELLEHVPDPRQQLVAGLKLLRPGGLLYGTTPNGRGLSGRVLGLRWSAFAPPEHLQLLTPPALRRACRATGYTDVRVVTRGTNPYELRTAFRSGSAAMSPGSRVQSGYDLNSRLESTPAGRGLRRAVNTALRLTSTGDSVVVRAHRASGG